MNAQTPVAGSLALATPPEPEALPSTGDEPLRGRILIVDDEPGILRGFERALRHSGATVATAGDTAAALALIDQHRFDAVVTDIAMPGADGLQLLEALRQRDPDVPVILITAAPTFETASRAVELHATRYLTKPVETNELREVLRQALRQGRRARLERQASSQLGSLGSAADGREQLGEKLSLALGSMWMAFQPIVSHAFRAPFAYEALLRSDEPALPNPMTLLEAAERLGRLDEVGRQVRAAVAAELPRAPPPPVFVNLHASDLLDESLYDPASPLTQYARRVVLEMTERAPLDGMRDVKERVAKLRELGYRIAVDDLGAGYAGLNSFALLEPEFVKLDMSLVRDIHRSPTKRRLARTIAELCRDVGSRLVAEGVEVVEERDALAGLGIDLFQGYYFARPAKGFGRARWDHP